MRATDILPQQTLDEVSMTPTDYAKDIEQAGPRGVLVGFEFEVCIPQSFRTGAREGDEVNVDKIAKLISHFGDDMFYDQWSADEIRKFDSIFRPKSRAAYNSMMDAVQSYQTEAVPQIKQLWEKQIPEETRIKITRAIKRSGKTYAELAKKRYDDSGVDIMLPEIQFAAAAVFVAYTSASIKISGWYWSLTTLIGNTLDGDFQLKRLFGNRVSPRSIYRNFNNYFDYDPQEAYKYLEERSATEDNMDDSDYDVDSEYRGGADRLAPLLKQTFGMPVTVFDDYHQSTKQKNRWYIEPDGSLDPDEDDSSAEIVTPPYPAPQAVGVLRDFFTLAKENGFYTSKENGTGLHINISIPKHVDVLKLALFVGDLHVLRQFGREFNNYAESVHRSLTKTLSYPGDIRVREIQSTPEMPHKIEAIGEIAKSISRNHTASVSDNGKYISFRHVGGNYLNDYSEIESVLGRFIRAMMIANDPAAHRDEYLKKLAKFIPASQQQTAGPLARYRAVINQLRNEGLPALQCYAFIWNSRVRSPSRSVMRAVVGDRVYQSLPGNVARFMAPDTGGTTKAEMLNALDTSGRMGHLRQSAVENMSKKMQNTNSGFYTGTWAPSNIAEIEAIMNLQPKADVQTVSSSGWLSDGYAIGKKTVIPPQSPQTAAAMQSVIAELRTEMQKLGAQKQHQQNTGRGRSRSRSRRR